eukprot:2933422-Pleurochrysis_carterae.AAC.1
MDARPLSERTGSAKGRCLGGAPTPPAPHCSGMHLSAVGVRLVLGQRRDARPVHRAASAVWLLGGYPSYEPPPPNAGPAYRPWPRLRLTQSPPLLCR